MHITYPGGARLQNIEAFVRKIEDDESPGLRLTLPDRLFAVHPMVLAATAAAALKARKAKAPVSVDHIADTRSTRYLERMGLFDLMGIKSGLQVAAREEAGRFIPLRAIRTGLELSKFISDLAPLLHTEDHKRAEPIQYVLSELVRNTLEHAGVGEPSLVAAQVVPSTGAIRIGVADCGSGIRASLRGAYETEDDLSAIQLALRPGITGTTSRVGGSSDNAGAGLFFCKAMAQTSRNYMVVHSGTGLFKLKIRPPAESSLTLFIDPRQDHATRYSDLSSWPGTMVGIDIDVNTFSEFRAMLAYIRDAYNVEVNAAARNAHKKTARFE